MLEKLEELLLFVERNVSSSPATVANNKSTLGTVKQAFAQANSTVFSKISSSLLDSLENSPPPTPSSTDSLIPLLPMNPSDESSELGHSTPTVTPTSSDLPGSTPSLLQRVGLASSRSAQFVHETFADIHYAEDRVVGTAFCDKTRGSYGHGQVVREVILPGNTTFMLLDLAILIEVIHLYAPIYSLFENHSSTSFPIPSLRSPGPTASTMMMTNI